MCMNFPDAPSRAFNPTIPRSFSSTNCFVHLPFLAPAVAALVRHKDEDAGMHCSFLRTDRRLRPTQRHDSRALCMYQRCCATGTDNEQQQQQQRQHQQRCECTQRALIRRAQVLSGHVDKPCRRDRDSLFIMQIHLDALVRSTCFHRNANTLQSRGATNVLNR